MLTEQEITKIKELCFIDNKWRKSFNKEITWRKHNIFNLYNIINNISLIGNINLKFKFIISGYNVKDFSKYYICKSLEEFKNIIHKYDLTPAKHKDLYKNNSHFFNNLSSDYTKSCWLLYHNINKNPICLEKSCSNELNIKVKNISSFCSSSCSNKHLNRKREWKESNLSDNEIKKIILSKKPDNRNPNHDNDIANIFINIVKWSDKFNLSNISNKEKIYHYLHNITVIPKCLCGKNKKFNNGTVGYFNTCTNNKCVVEQREIDKFNIILNNLTDNQKELINKWNITDRLLIKHIRENTNHFCNTCGKPIIVHNSNKSNYHHCSKDCLYSNKEFILNRSILSNQSKIDKYGFIYYGLTIEQLEQGYTNVSQLENIKEIKKESNFESFGHINAFHSPKARENFQNVDWDYAVIKQKNTVLFKYGVNNIMLIPEINKKVQENRIITNLEKYGFSNPTKNKNVRDKISLSKRNHFNTIRTNFGYNGYVYLLHSKSENKIKIGITTLIDINKRIDYIKKSSFKDLELISYFSSNNCYKDEKYLHEFYKEYNIVLDKSISGHTEWFRDDILESVKLHFKQKETTCV